MVTSKYYYINDVPVQIRYLPSGDIAVWHPVNIGISNIIESICRNRGRWDRQYNNWIVFKQYKFQVILDIERRGN